MSWVLLGNDDGVDSPALLPFARALERTLDLPVRICVPAFERSWSSKALTRHGHVRAEVVQREGRDVVAVDGTPADAVQLGLYSVFAEEFAAAPPRLVVTGINLGYNSGTAFLSSSGTVWAAAEAALAGLSAVAVSTGPELGMQAYAAWKHEVRRAGAVDDWGRVADVAADVVRGVSDAELGDHCDLVSVNLPWSSTSKTRRRVTDLTPMSYAPLFEPIDDGTWEFTSDLTVRVGETPGHGDVETLHAGEVSITPVVLPRSATLPDRTRRHVVQYGQYREEAAE